MNDIIIANVLNEKPREFLQALIEDGVKISEKVDNLTDDECRKICIKIIKELKTRENLQ